MNFIEELFYGNINPNERRRNKNSEYLKLLNEFCVNEKRLSNVLDSENLKLFNKLLNIHDQLIAVSEMENFKTGFVLGINMMLDCYSFDIKSIYVDLYN